MEHTIISGGAATQRHSTQPRGMDIKRICLILYKYAEWLEAEDAEAEQVDAPTAAAAPAAQSTARVSDHRQIL